MIVKTTTYSFTFTSSQPLTTDQIEHCKKALFNATQNLPGHDKEDFLDIPEFTTDVEVTTSPE